jgi:hypothetical protein
MSVEYGGIITSIVPPGGFHYPQLLQNGETVRLTAFSFEQLFETMLDFRRRHLELCGGSIKATIESVHSDLKDYLCKNFRQNCADAKSTPAVQSGGIGITNYVTPINKAADWLAAIGNLKIDKVDAALAAQRAQTCAQCAMNVRWQTSCQPCNDNVSVRIQNAKGSLHTPYDRHLFVCRLFGHSNEVAIWLTDTNSTSEQKPPAHCWKGG